MSNIDEGFKKRLSEEFGKLQLLLMQSLLLVEETTFESASHLLLVK